MGSKMVRLDDDVYERIRDEKRDDETFSETIERLIGGHDILELYGLRAEKGTEEMREAIADADETGRETVDELRRRARGDE